MAQNFPFSLLHLKYFCDAVKHGGISESAKINHVTQSAISQGIMKLEKLLNVLLIDHQPNRFKPTVEGEIIFQRAEEIFAKVHDLYQVVQNQSSPMSGACFFASHHSIANAMLPQVMRKFQRQYPRIKLGFQLGHIDAIKVLVHKDLVDFAIVLDDQDISEFEQKKLYLGKYGLYVARSLKKEFFKDLGLLVPDGHKEMVLGLKDTLKKAWDRDVQVNLKIDSWEVIANFIEEGLGVGLLPDYVAMKRKKLELLELNYPAKMDYLVKVIYLKDRPLNKAAVQFLSCFSELVG